MASVAAVKSSNIYNVLYEETKVKPDKFGDVQGRFQVDTNDGHSFYLHYQIMRLRSPFLHTWLTQNYDSVSEGVPLKVECSAKALQVLVDMCYEQTMHIETSAVWAGRNRAQLKEMVQLADMWLMTDILHHVADTIQHNAPYTQDYDRALHWFSEVIGLCPQERRAKLYLVTAQTLITITNTDQNKAQRESLLLKLGDFQRECPQECLDLLIRALTVTPKPAPSPHSPVSNKKSQKSKSKRRSRRH